MPFTYSKNTERNRHRDRKNIYYDFMRFDDSSHGLRTSNEGISQRYLKNWTDVADNICFGRT